MKIPNTKGLNPNFQQLDRAVREMKHAKTDRMAAILEALAKSQSTLNPNLSNISHNREFQHHVIDFII